MRHSATPHVADQLADDCRASPDGGHPQPAARSPQLPAVRCRIKPYIDQGGAYGAAGPASAPGSASEGPPGARRATAEVQADQVGSLVDQPRAARSRLPPHIDPATTCNGTGALRGRRSKVVV